MPISRKKFIRNSSLGFLGMINPRLLTSLFDQRYRPLYGRDHFKNRVAYGVNGYSITNPPQDPLPSYNLQNYAFPPSNLISNDLDPTSNYYNDEWSLISDLRDAASTKDPFQIMRRAIVKMAISFEFDSTTAWAKNIYAEGIALADLAITGRGAYLNYQAKTPQLQDLLNSINSDPTLKFSYSANVDYGAALVFDRVQKVYNALRGDQSGRLANRQALGWICVSAEDDPPDVPVNVQTAAYPQYYLTVSTSSASGNVISVLTRYMIATEDNLITQDSPAGKFSQPSIPGDALIIIYVHGHMSKLEEASDLAPALIASAKQQGQKVCVISFDQPCCGYSQMIPHDWIATFSPDSFDSLKQALGNLVSGNVGADTTTQMANLLKSISETPLLDFIEQFIIQFIQALDQQFGIANRVAAIIGGSLGGHMALRLATHTELPWLRSLIAWSPGSVWDHSQCGLSTGLTLGIMAVKLGGNILSSESGYTKGNYFTDVFVNATTYMFTLFGNKFNVPGCYIPPQPEMWYRDGDWEQYKMILMTQSCLERNEIYCYDLMRWHWRTALEMNVFSFSKSGSNGQPYYSKIQSGRLMLASGQLDNYNEVHIFDNTMALANTIFPRSGLFIANTGHSIHNERPVFFASQIISFLGIFNPAISCVTPPGYRNAALLLISNWSNNWWLGVIQGAKLNWQNLSYAGSNNASANGILAGAFFGPNQEFLLNLNYGSEGLLSGDSQQLNIHFETGMVVGGALTWNFPFYNYNYTTFPPDTTRTGPVKGPDQQQLFFTAINSRMIKLFVGKFDGSGLTNIVFFTQKTDPVFGSTMDNTQTGFMGQFTGNIIKWSYSCTVNTNDPTHPYDLLSGDAMVFTGKFINLQLDVLLYYSPANSNWYFGLFAGPGMSIFNVGVSPGGITANLKQSPSYRVWQGYFLDATTCGILVFEQDSSNWWAGQIIGSSLTWTLVTNTNGFGKAEYAGCFYVGQFTNGTTDEILFYFPPDGNWWLGQFSNGKLSFINVGNTKDVGIFTQHTSWSGNFSGNGDSIIGVIANTWWLGSFSGNQLTFSMIGDTSNQAF